MNFLTTTAWNSQGGNGNEASHIFINVPLYHGIFLNVLKIGRWSWPGKTFTGADWTKWGTWGKRRTVFTCLSAQLFHFGAVLIFIVKLSMGKGWYNNMGNEMYPRNLVIAWPYAHPPAHLPIRPHQRETNVKCRFLVRQAFSFFNSPVVLSLPVVLNRK